MCVGASSTDQKLFTLSGCDTPVAMVIIFGLGHRSISLSLSLSVLKVTIKSNMAFLFHLTTFSMSANTYLLINANKITFLSSNFYIVKSH